MSKLTYFSGIILGMTLLISNISCVDDCEDNFDITGGIITSELELGACFSDVGALDPQYVINDSTAFQALGILPVNTPECMGMTLPEIDFNTQTLLGLYADGTCNVGFDRIVLRDDDLKKYTYTVGVNACGMCESLRFSMNWVLVPKLPEDYTVEFIVE